MPWNVWHLFCTGLIWFDSTTVIGRIYSCELFCILSIQYAICVLISLYIRGSITVVVKYTIMGIITLSWYSLLSLASWLMKLSYRYRCLMGIYEFFIIYWLYCSWRFVFILRRFLVWCNKQKKFGMLHHIRKLSLNL